MISGFKYGFILAAFAWIASDIAIAAEGKDLYAARCAMCHGDKGAGDGAAAAAFPAEQKPASFATGQYKYTKDEGKFSELLKKGGAGVGLSAMMPPQPDLSDADIKSLYTFVSSLKQ